MSIYYHTQFLRIRIQEHLSWPVLTQRLSGSCNQAASLVNGLLKTQLRLENSILQLTHTVVAVLCHMSFSQRGSWLSIERKERTREHPEVVVTVLCNLVSGVIYHHFCCILPVTRINSATCRRRLTRM